MDRQPRQHHVVEELGDVVQLERGLCLIFLDPQGAGRGIEYNRVLSIAAGLEQGLLDFPSFGVGLFRQAFTFEGLAATQ